MPREIISGKPGETWTNNTDKVQFQFIASLNNTCGMCLQYHLKIANNWAIPLHHGCRCIKTLIKPGAKAPEPFCDYRKLLDGMDDSQKTAAIGASNYKLLKSGLAKWEDIVTPSRVRDFREVVAREKLTVKQMVDKGVTQYQAEKAHSAVHTTEHEHAERQRRELIQNLTGAGVGHDALVHELSQRLASRVTIAEGPTGPYTEGPAWSGGKKLPGTETSTAAEIAKYLAGWKPTVQKAAPKPVAPVKARQEPPPPEAFEPVVVQEGTQGREGEAIPPRPGAGAAERSEKEEPKLRYPGSSEEAMTELASQIAGKTVHAEHVAGLAGAPKGAVVDVSSYKESTLIVSAKSRQYAFSGQLTRQADESLVLKVDAFRVVKSRQAQGIGREAFSKQLDQAKKLGVDRIELAGARNDDPRFKQVGYKVWPKFGFDADLTLGRMASAPQSLRNAKKLSDLLTREGGQEWWDEHGWSVPMEFDMKPGSRSWQTWKAYVDRKKS